MVTNKCHEVVMKLDIEDVHIINLTLVQLDDGRALFKMVTAYYLHIDAKFY